MAKVGVVVIGRNEEARLGRALDSIEPSGLPTVYVDSCSSDGSVALARSRVGVTVLELDSSRPLNAARARNEGFARLRELHPDLELVQFLDGDTALDPTWLVGASRALAEDPRLAIVAGRLEERFASQSVFHLLCALEWRRPPGPVQATGGIFMARVASFAMAGGFDASVNAGEESELCQRVMAGGGRVEVLHHPMGVHDVGEMGFRQWWLRTVRTGHGYAQGAVGASRGRRRYARELRSAIAWGLALPLLALLAAWPTRGASLLLLGAYPLQALRIGSGALSRGWSRREAFWFGVLTTLAKLPEAVGALRYLWERGRGAAPSLVRYR